jgi:hypothetical protein
VTSTQMVTFLTLVATIVVTILLVVVGVSRLARLLFSQRLETIRDDCVDAILGGDLREVPSVKRFLEATEVGAAQPEILALPRVLAVYRAMVGLGIDMGKVSPPPSYDELEPSERAIMRRLNERLCRAHMSFLTWGSPIGWVRAPVRWFVTRVLPSSVLAEAIGALPAVARETLRNAPNNDWPVRRKTAHAHLVGR